MTLPSLTHCDWLQADGLQALLRVLEKDGGAARVAGGAVRNGLLGLAVNDVDIATSHVPDSVQRLCAGAGLRVHPTGIEHGTVSVVTGEGAGKAVYEVTTLRRDVATDGRRAVVAFTQDWREDAMRRDFTVNALYCDRAGTVFDLLGGFGDLVKGRIAFVGDGAARITEDALRILRFFRLHATYGKGRAYGPSVRACTQMQDKLAILSRERVRDEVLKTLVAPRALSGLRPMKHSGILDKILPCGQRLKMVQRCVEIDDAQGFSPDAMVRLAALSEGHARGPLRDALRLSNAQADRLERLDGVDLPAPQLTGQQRRVMIYRQGRATFEDAVRLGWASSLDSAGDLQWRQLYDLGAGWPVPRFGVTGKDLMARGIPAGPVLGEKLRQLENWWIEAGFPDDKAAILRHLDEM